jgi:hypothetical protein
VNTTTSAVRVSTAAVLSIAIGAVPTTVGEVMA